MIGKIIGALAGKKLAERTSGMSGTGGVIAGVAASSLLKRVGPLGLVAALAGGYLFKRSRDHKMAGSSGPIGR
jgi:hypothetical protein